MLTSVSTTSQRGAQPVEMRSKNERLKEVFALLHARPPSRSRAQAVAAVEQALREVENRWTDVADDRPKNYGQGRRMYLPAQCVDAAWSNLPGGCRANLTSHFADFYDSGRIEISTKSGEVAFQRAGSE